MAMEALSSNELLNFIIYDTISAAPPPYTCNDSSDTTNVLPEKPQDFGNALNTSRCSKVGSPERQHNLAVQGRKKRRRRPKVCKNKEEAETQRMTHITVERNRRKQMNEHLAVLRSLMPESYVQRGDQASIVGGAIDFVKELEHLLQSLEAQKLLQHQEEGGGGSFNSTTSSNFMIPTPFSQFFSFPQFTCSQSPNKFTSSSSSSSKSNAAVADIEVTLIETHANIRILSRRRRLRQLSKMVAGFHTLGLTILHLSLTSLDPLALYSISAKVEEGCQLNSADDIAGAIHQMLRIFEEEAIPYAVDQNPSLP